ncbi:MAG: putative Histidine kinase [Candidatus Saccharibacteria bacterium]|nr:putative Histidine kinase [Candidatus Saccharibacteria bacterium]
MFKSARLRLTLAYLAILMLISLFFSTILYSVSSHELDRGFRGESHIYTLYPHDNLALQDIQNLLDKRLDQSRHHLILNLLYTNIFVLLLGGGASYALATFTLKPIEESHEAQSRFTADASHELRTPLAAMQTGIEVALRDPKLTKEEAKDLLRSNLEELAKLTALSDGLLQLARLNRNDLPNERVSLAKVTQEAIDRVLPVAEQKGILLEQNASSGVTVIGDKAGLVEVVVILLENAVKYSPAKSRVVLTLKKQAKQASISVKDEGRGMKASELPHIFERFYRADSSRNKEQVSGYGLGLSIAKSVVDLHDGTITAQSQPSRGSTFEVKLPLA